MKKNMDDVAKALVRGYLKKVPNMVPTQFDVFIVWKCKTIQNWKYLCATTLPDGKYFELTYNGDKKEWYVDVYQKVDKQVVPTEGLTD